MHNLVLLAVCFLAGVILRRSGKLPENAPKTLNGYIIHVALPAVVLLSVRELRLSPDLLFMAAMPWLLFGLGAAFFLLLGRVFRLPRATVGALMLTGGLGNTSFVGLPMIEAFYGSEALVYGIVVDQLGSFMVLSTLGLAVAGIYSGGMPSATEMAGRIVMFPPFLALVAAVVLMPVDYPQWLTVVLRRLGDTLAPLALFSVGCQLHAGHFRGNGRNLAFGLGFKLFLAPLVLWLFYGQMQVLEGLAFRVTLFEAAMAPMVTAAIVATEQDINPPLANLMVAVGVVLSFLTLPLWYLVL